MSSAAKTQTNQNPVTVRIVLIAVMAAVICVLAPISIPLNPVPISLAILAVHFAVFALGWKRATISVLVYIALGMVGLPVFAGWKGGAGVIAGPTGGYIVGYIFLAIVEGLIIDWAYKTDKSKTFKIVMYAVGMVLGVAVCYAFGSIWFMILMKQGIGATLSMCVIPFLPGDALKIIVGILVGVPLRGILHKNALV